MFKGTARSVSTLSYKGAPKLIHPRASVASKISKEPSISKYPTEILTQATELEKNLSESENSLKERSNLLTERIEILENELKNQNKMIENIEKMLPKKKIDESSSITAETAAAYITNNPIILEIFVEEDSFSRFSSFINNANDKARIPLIEASLEQLNRVKYCVDSYKELSLHVHSNDFKDVFIKRTEELFDSKQVYLLIRDSKTSYFTCELNNAMSIKLNGAQDDSGFKMSLNPLFNPDSKEVFLVKIGDNAVLYIIYTSTKFSCFNKEDELISKLYSALVEPLLFENMSYNQINHRIGIQTKKRSFDSKLLKMDSFDKLLNFLNSTPLADSTIFIINEDNEMFFYKNINKQMVENIVEMNGIEEEAFTLKREITNFQGQGAYPIFDNNGKIIAIFTTYAITDQINMQSFCANLELVLPKCLLNAKRDTLNETTKSINILPNEVKDFTPEVIETNDFYTILIQRIISVINCAYVSLYINDKHILSMHNRESTKELINIKALQEPLISNCPSKIPKINGSIPLTSLLYVVNGDVKIVCMNSKAKFAMFSKIQQNIVYALSMFLLYKERHDNLTKEIIDQVRSFASVKEVMNIVGCLSEGEVSLQRMISCFAKSIGMNDFIAFEDKSVSFKTINDDVILDFDSVKEGISLYLPNEINLTSQNMKKFEAILSFAVDNWLFIFIGNKPAEFYQKLTEDIIPFIKELIPKKKTVVVQEIKVTKSEQDIDSLHFLPSKEQNSISVPLQIFKKMGLIDFLQTDEKTFTAFLSEIRGKYRRVMYHNWTHALDTFQFAYFVISQTNLKEVLRIDQIFCLLISALCHNMGHDGLSSYYHRTVKSRLTLLYGESTPHKIYSFSTLIDIVGNYKFNKILDNTQIWECCKSLFLATDIINFDNVIENFKKSDKKDQPLLDLIILCSNFSNITRPKSYLSDICDCIFREKLNENKKIDQRSAQVLPSTPADMLEEFINNYAQPAFALLCEEFKPLGHLLKRIEENVAP